jgi:hypothetical protein
MRSDDEAFVGALAADGVGFIDLGQGFLVLLRLEQFLRRL